jgi:hypothetical protein
MTLLKSIQRDRQPLPPRLVLYGTEGIGKSTFGSQCPAPVFIQTEDGLAEIDCDKFPLATSFDDVVGYLNSLISEPHEYQTVVIDSLDWLERLIWDDLCRQHHVSSIEKVDGGYAKGYTHALSHWRHLLGLLNRLRVERGMVVLCIAHARIEKFEDPEATAYDRYSPRLHSQSLLAAGRSTDAHQSPGASISRKRVFAPGTETAPSTGRAISHGGRCLSAGS